MKIVVKMPNWFGDVVMATPVLEDLRKKFPEAEISAMCQKNIAPLLEGNPFISEIFSYERPNGWIHHAHPYEILTELQKREFDIGILMTNSFSSAFWLLRGGIPKRIGFATQLRSPLLTDAVPFPKEKERQHLVLTYKKLLSPLDIPLSDTPTRLFVTEEERRQAKELLDRMQIEKDNILIGINPGAAYGSAKCWPKDRFEKLARHLVENKNVKVIFFADPTGAELVHDICRNLPESVINMAGRTSIRELMALIEQCSVFLTNDSGPMHIADALNVPLLALFGSTSDVKTGPYRKGKVIHKHVECSPCYKKVCPIDFRCMKRIEVQEVYDELQKLIR